MILVSVSLSIKYSAALVLVSVDSVDSVILV